MPITPSTMTLRVSIIFFKTSATPLTSVFTIPILLAIFEMTTIPAVPLVETPRFLARTHNDWFHDHHHDSEEEVKQMAKLNNHDSILSR